MVESAAAAPHTDGAPASPLGHLLADPSLSVFRGRYYLYPTTDGVEDWASIGFSVYSSDDLVNWHEHGEILRLGADVTWASGHAWAPAAVERHGRHYLYFTAGRDNIGVAVAGNPTGPFTDLGRPLIAAGDFAARAIDPSVLVDGDQAYLYWGNGAAHGVPLNADMTSFDPAQVRTFHPTGFREAAFVHRRGDLYYLSWSVDDTRHADYHLRYATGPGPLGPWTDQGVLLEKQPARDILATGHHSIVNIPGTDDWVIAYHRFAIPGGDGFHREVVFDRLVHRPDGLLEPVIPAPEPLRLLLNT